MTAPLSLSALTLEDAMDALAGQPPILCVKEAAVALGVSRSTVQRLVARGQLCPIRTSRGPGARLLFARRQLARAMVEMAEPR